MITEKRYILITSSKRMCEFLERFEGITQINTEKEIDFVWKCNKTPFVYKFKKNWKEYEDYFLTIPDFSEDYMIEMFTNWAHKNGFECGEYRTGEVVDTREEPCVLCSIGNHQGMSKDTTVYNKVVKKEVDCIIYESKNFYVTSELGSLKPGYLMIVPKEHQYLSIAQMPKMYVPEYEEVCRDIETILKGAFGDKPVAFFEHGSGPSGLTSHKKSIVHAHTHVVIDFVIDKKYLDMIQMKPLDDISLARNTHYFAYKIGADGQRYCCYDDNVYVQRQFPRQIMAMELGYTPGLYNWRKYDFSENIHNTLYFIYNFLSNSSLSHRIEERTKAFVDGYKYRDDFET